MKICSLGIFLDIFLNSVYIGQIFPELQLLDTHSELLDDPLSLEMAKKNDFRRFAKPCNQCPMLSAQRGYSAGRNRSRTPRPSPGSR